MNGHGHMIVLFAIGVWIQKKAEVIAFARIAARDFTHQKRRKKNDLPLFAAVDYLHSWRDCREAVGKTMNVQQEIKLLNYMQRIAIALEKLAEVEGTKVITKQSTPVRVTDNPALDLVDLHHVTYDNDQLGREK